MNDINKTLGWKPALVFFAGIVLVIGGIGLLLTSSLITSILGALLNVSGFVLLILNLRSSLLNKDLPMGGRLALFIPKLIFFMILLIISISFYFTSF